MKIGILIDEFVSGGAPILAVQEALGLRKLGHVTEILVGTRFDVRTQADVTGDAAIRFLVDEYPPFVRRMKFRFPFFSFFSPQHLLSAFYAPSVIKSKDYDLIIAHGLFSALIASRLRNSRKIPYFTIFWDPSSYILPKVYSKTPLAPLFFALLPVTSAVDRWAARTPDRLILGSRFHLGWFEKTGAKHIEVVYPGCFPAEALPQKREDFALAVDRWDIGSRPDIFLDVLKKSPAKFKLKVVGGWHDERFRESFEKKVVAYGLQDWVEVVGRVDFGTLKRYFQTARCFLHPTQEAFGMAALEAAAFGCPIIIPARSGVTDLFVHGEHGFFPKDKDDADEYAAYIARIMSDADLASVMSRKAWEQARTYAWDFHARRLDVIIKDHFSR